MGLSERFEKEKEEISELLTNIVNYHEIVEDLKQKANSEKEKAKDQD